MAEHHEHSGKPQVFGMIAEFDTPEELLHATKRAYEAGYRSMDAYSPFPIHGLAEAMGVKKTYVPVITLLGALSGTIAALSLQYFTMVWHYPYMAGGKPFNSWPSWMPVTFELTILFGAFAALGSMLAFNGLPRPYHPIFNAKRFERASSDGFFLCIEKTDSQYHADSVRNFLQELKPVDVSEVME